MPEDEKQPRSFGEREYAFAAAALVYLIAFVMYCVTIAPTVTFVDSGELILASYSAGVAHPPGFALYLILGHLFSLVPVGNVAVRLHLMSALFGGLASAMVTLASLEAILSLRTRPAKPASKKKKEKASKKAALETSEETSSKDWLITYLPAVAAGLVFAFSRTVWSYATIAEVYTLNVFLIATMFWLMFAWRRAKLTDPNAGDRRLYIAALVFGLGLCVHHVTVALTLPALAVLVFSTAGQGFFTSKRFLYAGLIATAALVLYLYLPIAALRSPLMNWGNPDTLERLWWHMSGRQYQVFFNFSFERIQEFLSLAVREFSRSWVPLTLAAAVAGLVFLYRRERTLFWTLLLVMLANILYCMSYYIADDKDAYYLPTFLSITFAAMFGLYWLLSIKLARAVVIGAALVLPLVAVVSNFNYNTRSSYFMAHDYVDNVLKSIEPGGMLLTADWQLYAPSMYVREIEQTRRDAVIIDINLLRRSFYFTNIGQTNPQVIARFPEKVNLLIPDLLAFEKDPAAYQRPNTPQKQSINLHHSDVLASLVTDQLKSGAPLYLGIELANPDNPDATAIKNILGDKYDLVPAGLIFRVAEKPVSGTLEQPKINTRGLNVASFDEDDVVRRVVIPAYLMMLSNDGAYLTSRNMREAAIQRYEAALAIDPTYENAKKGIAAARSSGPNK
jgi:hypothetical protein